MKWFDDQPLFGRRIVVTRPEHQAEDMARHLRAKGAEAVVVPAITIAPPPEPERLRAALDVLGSYDLVAFTSANGVDGTFEALAALRRDARAFGAAMIAAIGPGTESALGRHAVVADVVAAEFRGEGLAAAIVERLARRPAPSGKRPRVLILRALAARDALPAALRAAEVEVDIVAVYETKPAPLAAVQELARELEARTIDAVTFTSGSTVKEIVQALAPRAADLLAGTTLAAIGPVTAEVARAEGLNVEVVAGEYTVAGLIDALERHFATRPRS
jgi:uroporphyrinogen III methyltransferase/synthase